MMTEPPLKKQRLMGSNGIITAQLKVIHSIQSNDLNKSGISIAIYLRESAPRADHRLELIKAIEAPFDNISLNKLIKSNIKSQFVLCDIVYDKNISKYKILYIFDESEITDKIESNSDKYDSLKRIYQIKRNNSNDKENRFILTSTITEFTNICTEMLYKRYIKPQRRFHKFLVLSDLQNMDSFIQYLRKWILNQCITESVEIETKIGKIISNKTKHRLQKNNILYSPFIDLKAMNSRFEVGVDGIMFYHLISKIFNKYYRNCIQLKPQQRVNELKNVSFPKLQYLESKTMDQMYWDSNIRSTWNLNDGQIRFGKDIEKIRLDSLNIAHKTRDYDFRISASRERVIDASHDATICKQNVKMIRFKHRRYYYTEWFSLAITETYSYKGNLSPEFIEETQKIFVNKRNDINKSKMPINVNGAKRKFEIELEIVKEYLTKCVKLYKENKKELFHDLVHEYAQASYHLVNLTNKFVPISCKVPPK